MRDMSTKCVAGLIGAAWMGAWGGGCGDSAGSGSLAAPDQPVLTRSNTVPPGAACANGGTAVQSGRDRDRDGVLEDAEIEHTEYVCSKPSSVLTREDPLDPSAACPAGGTAVATGVDDNGDGTLQDAEIDQTTTVCSSLELWRGDFTTGDWADPIKVAALKGARVVMGSLAIAPGFDALPLLQLVTGDLSTGGTVALPALTEVGGSLHVASDVLAYELPALAKVGGDVLARSGFAELSLPVLSEIHGDLIADGGFDQVALGALIEVHGAVSIFDDAGEIAAPVLREIDGDLTTDLLTFGPVALPALQTLGGGLELQGGLTALQLDQLVSIGGGLHLDSEGGLRFAIALPALQTVTGGIDIDAEGNIPSIDLPALARIDGDLTLSFVSHLTRLALPSATEITGNISISFAERLASIDLGALVRSGSLVVAAAPLLTTLTAPALTEVHADANGTGGTLELRITGVEILELPALTSVDGQIRLTDDPALRTVQLAKLTAARSMVFSDCPVLDSLAAPQLSSLFEVDFFQNAPIRSLDLSGLATAGSVRLNGTALADLSGLRALRHVSLLELLNTTDLPDLTGLSRIEEIGSLALENNHDLASLDGLEGVTELPSRLTVEDNPVLVSTTGLGHVTHAAFVAFERNPALADLSLPSLVSIDGALVIEDMDAVTSLVGLDALASVGGEIAITGNDNLSADAIAAFVQRLGH